MHRLLAGRAIGRVMLPSNQRSSECAASRTECITAASRADLMNILPCRTDTRS